MAKRLLIVLGAGLICGIGAGIVWDSRIGVSIGLLLAVLGTILVVLRRNEQDLEELERGQVPDAIDKALGDQEDS